MISASMNAPLSTDEQRTLGAEIAAFTFRFTNDDKSPWGTFFAPQRSEQRNGGAVIHDPDLAQLDSKSVDVWARRATTCANPVLTSRYADLIWDLEQKIVGHAKRRPEFARLAFDAYLRAVHEERFLYPPFAAQALKRALEIAGEMHDSEKITQATEAILEFGITAPAGLLTIFSKTLSTKNKPDSTTMKRICSLLEQRLTKVIAESHQMEVESAVHALARIIHEHEDAEAHFCYKHDDWSMFEAGNEASACLKIAQHSVCCSLRFLLSLPCCSLINRMAVPMAEPSC
jgi:hypothetical protein